MKNNVKNIAVVSVMGLLLFGLSIWAWFKPADDFSDSERRALAKFPELSMSTILDSEREKTFMNTFESYTLDQFPLRDTFRTLKSFASFFVFGNKENNDLGIENGTIAKIEYPLNEDSLDYASDRFHAAASFLNPDANYFFSIVPDKGYFFEKDYGYPTMSYEELFAEMAERMEFAEYIDITGTLSLEDYYKTDTHWRQEALLPAANKLAEAMGVTLSAEYTEQLLDNPFYGVYYGQIALPFLPADEMKYLTNDILEGCTVYNYQEGRLMGIYDLEKAYGKDPYEMYLSGNMTAVKITNPNATTDKELIVFRDSFGTSITPLLVEAYKEIIVLDIRYASMTNINAYRDNTGRIMVLDLKTADDVLFLYSSLILNSSEILK